MSTKLHLPCPSCKRMLAPVDPASRILQRTCECGARWRLALDFILVKGPVQLVRMATMVKIN